MSQYVSGLFYDPDEASRAVDDLLNLGYSREDINVAMSGTTREKYFADGDRDSVGGNMARAAAGGGMIGGTLGAIVGAFALTGAVGVTAATGGLAAPFVAGPLAAALASAGAGAAAGSVIGALVGAGMPAEDRARLERGIDNGGIVVAVNADDRDVERVRAVLEPGDATRDAELAAPIASRVDI